MHVQSIHQGLFQAHITGPGWSAHVYLSAASHEAAVVMAEYTQSQVDGLLTTADPSRPDWIAAISEEMLELAEHLSQYDHRATRADEIAASDRARDLRFVATSLTRGRP